LVMASILTKAASVAMKAISMRLYPECE